MTSDRWLLSRALGSVAFGAASLLSPLYVVTIGGTTLFLGVLAGTALAAFIGWRTPGGAPTGASPDGG